MKSFITIPEKMKALVLHGVGDLRLDEVAVPELKAGTVLVKIRACGICSSDIPRIFVNGTYHFPTIPGHEFSGQIVAVGDEADEALLGRRTCVFPLLPCKSCKACEIEAYAQCSNYNYFGSRCDGGFAEYLVVPVWNLVPFDDSISYEAAALCEPAAVSLHAVSLADIKKGQKVAVVGTGTIGFLMAAFARDKGAEVVICGRSDDKIAYAEELGFQTLHMKSEAIEEDVRQLIAQDGFDAVIEGVGSNEAIEMSIRLTGALGTVVLVGNPTDDLHLSKNVYWSVLRKQITVKGSWNSSYNSKVNDWAEALRILKNSDFDYERFVTHKFAMEDYEKAFGVCKDKKEFMLKVMLVQDGVQEQENAGK